MKFPISKENLKYLIIISWCVLIFSCVLKYFGLVSFDITTDNKKLLIICNFVDNHLLIKMIIAVIFSLISNYFILCILMNKTKLGLKDCLIFFPLIIAKSVLSWFIGNYSIFIDVFTFIILPLILNKKNWKIILINPLFILFFEFITFFLRNINKQYNQNLFLVQCMYLIDYICMILIYYGYYFKRKEV